VGYFVLQPKLNRKPKDEKGGKLQRYQKRALPKESWQRKQATPRWLPSFTVDGGHEEKKKIVRNSLRIVEKKIKLRSSKSKIRVEVLTQ